MLTIVLATRVNRHNYDDSPEPHRQKGVGFAANVALLYCGCAIGGKAMPEQNLSAFAAMRALRDELRARLDQNEDYRAWKALDEALREVEPRTVPKAVDLAHTAKATPPEHTDAKLPQVDDADLSFVRRDPS